MGADVGPLARLEAVCADPETPSVVFQRLTDGDETLAAIARAWNVPVGRFVEWFTTEHADLYDTALKVLGANLGHEVKALTDGATAETVALVKLKTDRYLRLASHWNAERYSPKVEHQHKVAPVFGVVLLEHPSSQMGAVIDVTPVPEPRHAALAAPVPDGMI